MNWGPYEVFAVLSGLVLVGAAFVREVSLRDRLICAAVGVGMAGYGIHVAEQTEGIYYFPVQIFLAPILAVVYVGRRIYDARTGTQRGMAAYAPPPLTPPGTPSDPTSDPSSGPIGTPRPGAATPVQEWAVPGTAALLGFLLVASPETWRTTWLLLTTGGPLGLHGIGFLFYALVGRLALGVMLLARALPLGRGDLRARADVSVSQIVIIAGIVFQPPITAGSFLVLVLGAATLAMLWVVPVTRARFEDTAGAGDDGVRSLLLARAAMQQASVALLVVAAGSLYMIGSGGSAAIETVLFCAGGIFTLVSAAAVGRGADGRRQSMVAACGGMVLSCWVLTVTSLGLIPLGLLGGCLYLLRGTSAALPPSAHRRPGRPSMRPLGSGVLPGPDEGWR